MIRMAIHELFNVLNDTGKSVGSYIIEKVTFNDEVIK